MRVASPSQPLLFPTRIVRVATILNEVEQHPVADQITAGLKRRNACLVRPEFVVPAVTGSQSLLAQTHGTGGYLHQPVLRRVAGFAAGLPGGMRLDIFNSV